MKILATKDAPHHHCLVVLVYIFDYEAFQTTKNNAVNLSHFPRIFSILVKVPDKKCITLFGMICRNSLQRLAIIHDWSNWISNLVIRNTLIILFVRIGNKSFLSNARVELHHQKAFVFFTLTILLSRYGGIVSANKEDKHSYDRGSSR